MSPDMRFTPPRRANRRIAGLLMPWMLSRRTTILSCGGRNKHEPCQDRPHRRLSGYMRMEALALARLALASAPMSRMLMLEVRLRTDSHHARNVANRRRRRDPSTYARPRGPPPAAFAVLPSCGESWVAPSLVERLVSRGPCRCPGVTLCGLPIAVRHTTQSTTEKILKRLTIEGLDAVPPPPKLLMRWPYAPVHGR
jgi:hypothetical protein